MVCGCIDDTTETTKIPVIINQPNDNTVNGYRNDNSSSFPDKIEANSVLNNNTPITTTYCGNKNSKKFHKISCSALKNTKQENKIYFKTRNEYIQKGYTPCKICNP